MKQSQYCDKFNKDLKSDPHQKIILLKKAQRMLKTLKTQAGTSYTIKKLKRKTKYTYAVKAFLKNGSTTVWSDVQTTKTVKTK